MKKTHKKKKRPKNIRGKKEKPANWLERETAKYFNSLSTEALEEENRLGAAVAHAASQVDFDAEY